MKCLKDSEKVSFEYLKENKMPDYPRYDFAKVFFDKKKRYSQNILQYLSYDNCLILISV